MGKTIGVLTAMSVEFKQIASILTDTRTEKIGPMIVKVANAVTRTVTSGVTKRSIISGTILCSSFSSFDISKTAKDLLGLEIKWSQEGLIPEYLTLVCGIFYQTK